MGKSSRHAHLIYTRHPTPPKSRQEGKRREGRGKGGRPRNDERPLVPLSSIVSKEAQEIHTHAYAMPFWPARPHARSLAQVPLSAPPLLHLFHMRPPFIPFMQFTTHAPTLFMNLSSSAPPPPPVMVVWEKGGGLCRVLGSPGGADTIPCSTASGEICSTFTFSV